MHPPFKNLFVSVSVPRGYSQGAEKVTTLVKIIARANYFTQNLLSPGRQRFQNIFASGLPRLVPPIKRSAQSPALMYQAYHLHDSEKYRHEQNVIAVNHQDGVAVLQFCV